MAKEGLVKLAIPELPEHWDYDESVHKTKAIVYKWKTLTKELAEELWIAREILSRPGRPKKNRDKSPSF
jgi:hypothetical protein